MSPIIATPPSPSLCIVTTSTWVPYILSPFLVTSATFHVHSLLVPLPNGGGGGPLLELVYVIGRAILFPFHVVVRNVEWREGTTNEHIHYSIYS